MDDPQTREITIARDGPPQISAASVVCATAAAVAVGGPLLGLMSLSLLATVTLFLVASPLLLIFSPLLLGAVVVLGVALAGFGAAGSMAVAGLCTLVWTGRLLGLRGGVVERMVESAGVRLKEIGHDPRGYLRHKSKENFTGADAS